jgi:hypothetical protein
MTKELLNEIEKDYWNEKADPIDMAEVFDLANRALEQSCDDCISRADILDAIETWDKFGINAEQKLIRWQDHYVPYVHLDDVRNAIANMPSVTPTRPKGKWIHWTDDYKDYATCSCCGYGEEGEVLLSDKTSFCPICGADMRGDTE